MALFVTKDSKRKSPMVLTVFFTALLDCLVFVAAYALLTDPLHRLLPFESSMLENMLHGTLISLAGTAVCCLLFLLPDKRIVPYGFAGLPVVTLMCVAAATQLAPEQRSLMIYLTLLYTLLPVLVGNLVSWTLYYRFWRGKRRMRSF